MQPHYNLLIAISCSCLYWLRCAISVWKVYADMKNPEKHDHLLVGYYELQVGISMMETLSYWWWWMCTGAEICWSVGLLCECWRLVSDGAECVQVLKCAQVLGYFVSVDVWCLMVLNVYMCWNVLKCWVTLWVLTSGVWWCWMCTCAEMCSSVGLLW